VFAWLRAARLAVSVLFLRPFWSLVWLAASQRLHFRRGLIADCMSL
jgi:hypothetical protein